MKIFFNRIPSIILFCFISILFVPLISCTANGYHSVLSGCIEDSEVELLNQIFDSFVVKITTRYNDQNFERCLNKYVSDIEQSAYDDVSFKPSPEEQNLIWEYINSVYFEKNWKKPDPKTFIDEFSPGDLYSDCLTKQNQEMKLIIDHYSLIGVPSIVHMAGSFRWIFMEKKVHPATGVGVFIYVYLKGIINSEIEKMRIKQLFSLFLSKEEVDRFDEKTAHSDIDLNSDYLSCLEELGIVFKKTNTLDEETKYRFFEFLGNRVNKLSGNDFSMEKVNIYDDSYWWSPKFQNVLTSYEKKLKQEGFDILLVYEPYGRNYTDHYVVVIPSDKSDILKELQDELDIWEFYFLNNN